MSSDGRVQVKAGTVLEVRRATLDGAGARPTEVDDEAVRLSWKAIPLAFAVAPKPCFEALEHATKAQALAPSYALPKAIAAWCLTQRTAQNFRSPRPADSDNAGRLASEACALAPDDALVLSLAAGAHFGAGRYERAASWALDGVNACPDSFWGWRIAAAAASHAGDRDEARRTVRRVLCRDPDLTVAEARQAWPFTAGFVDRLGDGLAAAGLPNH